MYLQKMFSCSQLLARSNALQTFKRAASQGKSKYLWISVPCIKHLVKEVWIVKIMYIRMDTVRYILVSYLLNLVRDRALNMEIQLVVSFMTLALNLQHVSVSHSLGRCSSLSSVLSAFGCAVWLCWCGTFYRIIFSHKECGGRGLVGAELYKLTALWMACLRFLFISFDCFYRSLLWLDLHLLLMIFLLIIRPVIFYE